MRACVFFIYFGARVGDPPHYWDTYVFTILNTGDGASDTFSLYCYIHKLCHCNLYNDFVYNPDNLVCRDIMLTISLPGAFWINYSFSSL